MEIPDRIGSYEIVGPAGEGGMGLVFEAREPDLGRRVAIKFPKDAPGETGALLRARFEREAKALSALRHPNLITLYEAGVHEGRPYAVMEWVEGQTLEDKIKAEGAMFAVSAARTVAKLAMATHYLHLNGYLHRDIKPGNVLLRDGEPILSDLGLAKDIGVEEGDSGLTIAGRPMGTPDYAAPELIKGDVGAMGPRTDVFGLGATLYFLLTARPPRGISPTIGQFLAQQIAPASRHRRDLDPQLSDLCRRALAATPERRFRSAQSFADSLIRWAVLAEGEHALRGKGYASLWAQDLPFEGFDARPGDPERAGPFPWHAALSIGLAALGLLSFGASWVLGDPAPEIVRVTVTPDPSSSETALKRRLAQTLQVVKNLEKGQRELVREAIANRSLVEDERLRALRGDLERLRRRVRLLEGQQERRPKGTEPAWFLRMPEDVRPPLPLPPGLAISEETHRYHLIVDGSLMVWVPPGSVKRHGGGVPQLVGEGFFLAVHEVTRRQYMTFCDETGYEVPHGLRNARAELWERPVGWVRFRDAEAYARWTGARLPTELEWELAATGRTGTRWPWGDVGDMARCNSASRRDPYSETGPVGALPDGASPQGVLDLAGNVSEWVRQPAIGHATSRPLSLGNSFSDPLLDQLTDYRRERVTDFCSPDIGFRLAISY